MDQTDHLSLRQVKLALLKQTNYIVTEIPLETYRLLEEQSRRPSKSPEVYVLKLLETAT